MNFAPLRLWYFSSLRVDSYQNFLKIRTKTCFLGFAKYLSSEKCLFDHEKDKNRNLCQARMKDYGLGYILLGWISSNEYDSREKHQKHQKFRNHLNLFESNYIFSLDLIFFFTNFFLAQNSNIIYICFENIKWFLNFWCFSGFSRLSYSL